MKSFGFRSSFSLDLSINYGATVIIHGADQEKYSLNYPISTDAGHVSNSLSFQNLNQTIFLINFDK